MAAMNTMTATVVPSAQDLQVLPGTTVKSRKKDGVEAAEAGDSQGRMHEG